MQKTQLEETCESDNPCRGPPFRRTRKTCRYGSLPGTSRTQQSADPELSVASIRAEGSRREKGRGES